MRSADGLFLVGAEEPPFYYKFKNLKKLNKVKKKVDKYMEENYGVKNKINFALINYYEEEKSNIGYHSDDMDNSYGFIISLSLGESRIFSRAPEKIFILIVQ